MSYLVPCAFEELKILTSACFSLATFERTFASRPVEGDQWRETNARVRREGRKPPEENNNSNSANQGTSPLRPKTRGSWRRERIRRGFQLPELCCFTGKVFLAPNI